MRADQCRQPAGFSRVDLLAVLAVAALAAGLLPAAIQQTREGARRIQCRDNLRLIGIACHNYHDTYSRFPPGWFECRRASDSHGAYGWQTRILSFVDYLALYRRVNFNASMPPEPTTDLKTAIAAYRCPSDPTEVTNRMRSNFGTSNYSGNYGSIAAPRWAPGPLAQFWPGAVVSLHEPNGILVGNVCIRVRDIADGTANTFFAGERSVKSAAGIWPGLTSSQNETDQVTDCSAGNEINSGIGAFSSVHSGGANFAFCDGSVRFISEAIQSRDGEGAAMGVFQKLAARNDHQPVTPP
jgi:prepilin-type processing-associated H-X9-DG protein